jgi:hypothetical protein
MHRSWSVKFDWPPVSRRRKKSIMIELSRKIKIEIICYCNTYQYRHTYCLIHGRLISIWLLLTSLLIIVIRMCFCLWSKKRRDKIYLSRINRCDGVGTRCCFYFCQSMIKKREKRKKIRLDERNLMQS